MDNEIEERGSVLFGVPRGMTAKLASRMIDDGVMEELMPPQKSYREKRRKEMRRVLYNLIRARSLSRAHSREIKVAVPLAMIHDNEKEYHRVSHRGVKSVIEAFSKAEMIEVEQGKPFLQCPTDWKKKCVRENNLKGKMTEVWAKGRLKEKIDDYLAETTHVGADVKIHVEEKTVMLEDNSGSRIRTLSSHDARRMRNTVKKVNEAVPQTGVRLILPLATVSPLSSTSSNTSEASSTIRNTHPFNTSQKGFLGCHSHRIISHPPSHLTLKLLPPLGNTHPPNDDTRWFPLPSRTGSNRRTTRSSGGARKRGTGTIDFSTMGAISSMTFRIAPSPSNERLFGVVGTAVVVSMPTSRMSPPTGESICASAASQSWSSTTIISTSQCFTPRKDGG